MPIEKKTFFKIQHHLPQKPNRELKQRLQQKKTILGISNINGILTQTLKIDVNAAKGLRATLDKILTQ